MTASRGRFLMSRDAALDALTQPRSRPSLVKISGDVVVKCTSPSGNFMFRDVAHCAIAGSVVSLPMPTADATLLPPAHTDDDASFDDRGSTRHIEDVGAHAVLGAMVEAKKRASIPAAIECEESAAEFDRDRDVARPRRPATSEVFLKAR
ncbi:MAG: hypothetical protein JST00_19695 [Deltaproteobacteria bacterium]|nr:hypothetical protein [Deltaproteobacteria bacterium]